MPSELDYVLRQLRDRTVSLAQIEKDTGLDESWLSKLVRGLIDDPGVRKIELLGRYFRLLEKHEAERAALGAPRQEAAA